MARVTYPSGDTTASRVKALALWLEKHRDRAAGEALVREIKIDPEYLADETRPLAIATWCRALSLFAERYGRETIRETWSGVINAENLGVWTRVLRGAGGPEGALARLDALGGDEAKTSRWETVSVAPGRWHGRVTISHDPAYERDGLCSLARAAELTGVPAMFGLGPGTVEIVPGAKAVQAAARAGGIAEDYVLSWPVRSASRVVYAGLGAAVAAGLATLPRGGTVAALAALAAGTVSSGVGAALQASHQRKAESHAQLTRIRALERGVTLKEEREKAAVGFFEGSVVAGKYRLGRKLGAGASGVIYQATRLSDNGPVAIKLLRAAVAHDMVASDRLRREAEALGLTWHPNVVEVFEHDHLADGTAYLVMEQLDGESLATRLRRDGRLTPRATLPLMTQLCDALGAVHAAGVIHRDVKPSNIFIVSAVDATQAEQVKLIDFGIARVEWAETRLTNMGYPLGTPGYMSPEQEHGEEIDARSDLFALGAVIYECLSGMPPPTPVSGSYSIAPMGQSAPPASVPHAPSIPAAWLKVIARAMAPLPQERYADARATRQALMRLGQAEPNDEGATAGAESGGTKSETDVKKTNVSK